MDATTDSKLRATALHAAVFHPLEDSAVSSPGEAVEQSLRCVKALLRAGADTRLRRFDGMLAVEFVMLVGDLRIADAIFAAEERRGILVDDEDAERIWPENVKRERALRAAVAAYRNTGDAELPSALRLNKPLEVEVVDRPPGAGPEWRFVDSNEAIVGRAALSKAVSSAGAVTSPVLVARQTALAGLAPREADAAARRCYAPGCATLGALLKACPCRTAWYCRCGLHVACLVVGAAGHRFLFDTAAAVRAAVSAK